MQRNPRFISRELKKQRAKPVKIYKCAAGQEATFHTDKTLTIVPRLKNALVQEPVLERVLKTTLHTNRFPNHSEICPYWDILGLHKQIHVTPTKPRPGESLVAGFRYSCLSVRSTGLVSKVKHILILVRDVAHGLSFPFRSQSMFYRNGPTEGAWKLCCSCIVSSL